MAGGGVHEHPALHPSQIPPNSLEDVIDILDLPNNLPFEQLEKWVGARRGNYRAMMNLIPLVGFYEGLYMKVASKKVNYIHVKPPKDKGKGRSSVEIHRQHSELAWFISYASLKDELLAFYRDLTTSEWAEENGLSDNLAIDAYLEQYGISLKHLKLFHEYFSSSPNYDEKLLPDREVSCAWPLGCPQNLPKSQAPHAGLLLREYEHCKPKTHGETASALQSMCYMHNMWKADHVLWDLHTLTELFFGD